MDALALANGHQSPKTKMPRKLIKRHSKLLLISNYFIAKSIWAISVVMRCDVNER